MVRIDRGHSAFFCHWVMSIRFFSLSQIFGSLITPLSPILPTKFFASPIIWGVILAALCWHCTPTPEDPIIRMGLAHSPTNLDPRFATDATSARVNRLLYSRLVDFGTDATPIPALATWTQPSPTHYIFRLKNPLPRFHDGSRLTSVDVKATYESILSPQSTSPHRGVLQIIERVEQISDEKISFFLRRTDPLFPSYLVIGILPAKLIAKFHPFHTHPIGTGPFRFLDRPDDTRLRLVRIQDNQTVELLRIPDPTVRTLKLLSGEIHLLQNDLPPELITYLSQQEGIHLQQHRGSNFAYLGFNQLDPIVGQIQVRKAIAHAIDRSQIIHYVFGGRARPAQALFPPDHWAGPQKLAGYSYNPQKAIQFLREAGFDDTHKPTLIYKTSTDPFRLRLATIIQDQLRKVGIQVIIHSHDWGTFYGDIKSGRFQMYSLAWVGVKSPDIFRYAFHSESIPPAGANRGRFSSPLADTLILQAEQETNHSEQQALYQTLQAHFLDTLPYVPLWFEDHYALSTTKVRGYRVQSDGNYDGLNDIQWTSDTSVIQQVLSSTGRE